MATLSERDRGLLQNKIDDLNKSNKQLQDSIASDQNVVNNLQLFDISSKKFVDEKHLEIYSLEEERRLLTGKTIIVPVEEDAFWITTTELNTTLTINDGRLTAQKNDIVFVDVPITSARAYILSKAAGTDFEIWTRDRKGSTTSEANVPASYSIHSGNNKLTVKIDSITADVKIFEDLFLEIDPGQQPLVIDSFVLSAKLTEGLATAGFTNAQCIYNQNIQTFTIASGTGGTSSTVEVITSAIPTDLANLMKFTSNQVKVVGKYANNKFKVKIDGTENELTLGFDVRIPVHSSLGYAIDDFSADWRQTFSGGLQPAQSNNGAKISLLIQSQLRGIGSDGYLTAECLYYSDSEKFVIYSGTFGNTSSIEILPASDTNRDFRFTIGMDEPTDSRNNETSYNTLQDLYNYLNQNTCLLCSNLSNPTYDCYSLLSVNNALISNIQLVLQTTSMYDRASLSQPNLYGNKIRINSQVNSFDILEGSTPVSVFIPDGDYSESELSSTLQDLLNANTTASNEYVVQYKQAPLSRFIITAKNNFRPMFGTGNNKSTSISTFMGFANFSDPSANKVFISNAISFAGVDFFSMAAIPQFVPYAYLNNQPPYYDNTNTFTESMALSIELSMSSLEAAAVTALMSQINIDNDVRLSNWASVADSELVFKRTSLQMIGFQLSIRSAAYGTADPVYLDMLAEYNSLSTDINDVLSMLPDKTIMHLRQEIGMISKNIFGEGQTTQVVVLTSGVNDDRIYDRPAVEFRYDDAKFLPTKNMTPTYRNNVNYKLQEKIGFSLQTDMATFTTPDLIVHPVTDVKVTIDAAKLQTTVYWVSGSAVDMNLSFISYPNASDVITAITAQYSTSIKNEIWSRYTEKYMLFNGDSFSILIGAGSVQTINISCSNGSSISGAIPMTSIASGMTLDVALNGESTKTITFPWTTMSGLETAAIIQSLIRLLIADSMENQFAYSNFICTYQGGTYNLYSGTSGTGSIVNVTGGTAQLLLQLGSIEAPGTGPFANNYFITAIQVASILSFSGVSTTVDSGYIKFTSTATIQITSSDCATRLGFYTDNLVSDTATELQTVASSSLQRILDISVWHVDRNLLRGYEYKDLLVTYNVTDDVTMNQRLLQIANRIAYIGTRQAQIAGRIPVIEVELSPTLYLDRWTQVINRLNKKTGSYYAVGSKKINIINTQNTIIDNNAKIVEIQTMLGS